MAAVESGPELIRDKARMRAWSRRQKEQGKTVGLVPTMGSLHSGHLSLVREARAHADLTVVSIYINPSQFAPSEDLATYPSDLSGDLRKLLAAGGVDAVFCPPNLYDYAAPSGASRAAGKAADGSGGGDRGDEGKKVVSCIERGDDGGGHETWIRVERLEKGLCGKSRPVFFRGVTTVVAKLFNIVEPDVAVFGKKDYQQWRIVCRMVRDLDFEVKIIGSDIMREVDGLAMSSRNVHLSPKEREKALSISRSLSKAKFVAANGKNTCQELKDIVSQTIMEAGGRIDYVEIVEQESLIAVEEITSPVVMCVAAWFGNVRLIDNMEVNI